MPTRPPVELVNGKTHATTAAELAPYHVDADEARCKMPNGAPCVDCGGAIKVSFAVLRRFKRIRDAHGGPLDVTCGHRCHAHQVRTYNAAPQSERDKHLVAVPGNSPHEFGEALDVAAPAGYTAKTWGEFCLQANKGDLRVGCLDYVGFAHLDTMFLVDPAKGKGILW